MLIMIIIITKTLITINEAIFEPRIVLSFNSNNKMVNNKYNSAKHQYYANVFPCQCQMIAICQLVFFSPIFPRLLQLWQVLNLTSPGHVENPSRPAISQKTLQCRALL